MEGNKGRNPVDPRILMALWIYATTESISKSRTPSAPRHRIQRKNDRLRRSSVRAEEALRQVQELEQDREAAG